METSSQPTPPVPREPIRKIDWLAIAPWLIVLRSVGATIGFPLVLGAIGMLTLEWSSSVGSESGFRSDRLAVAQEQLVDWPGALMRWKLQFQTSSWTYLVFWPLVRWLGWMTLGMAIIEHAARRITASRRISPFASIRSSLSKLPRLLATAGLLGLPAALLAAVIWLYGLAMNGLPVTGAVWGVMALLFAVPLTLLVVVGLFASPLLAASLVIDKADPFDALSRTFSYVFQRPGTLALGVATAWLGAIVAGAVLQWGQQTVLGLMMTLGAVPEGGAAEGSALVFTKVVNGFYPAYLFASGAAVYLLMRHAIDGQPIDEMAGVSDQASSAA